MDPSISIVTLGVDDLAVSVEFYEDGLGLPKHDDEGEIAFFELSGTWLALYPREALAADVGVDPEGSGFAGVTLAHNVDGEARVDEVLAEAERAGATVVKSATHAEWGGYSGYFADPDGHLWEVAHAPDFSPGP
ncbi:VOC family protein [Halobaculum roseum]|uniref:VOC family protein n=1 Tax=Halobaculum roseum TaxID=2175149 RepID=A0ABD5MKE5_9EURY|nr:VOC family protein [Halobaculum roseum]QZY03207.1 VOC family protein [Halobaculum roseum]